MAAACCGESEPGKPADCALPDSPGPAFGAHSGLVLPLVMEVENPLAIPARTREAD